MWTVVCSAHCTLEDQRIEMIIVLLFVVVVAIWLVNSGVCFFLLYCFCCLCVLL